MRENVAGFNDQHLHFSGVMASMALPISYPFRYESPMAVVMAFSYLVFTYHFLPRAHEIIDKLRC